MHMANELLSIPVATGTLAIAAAGLGFLCRKVRQIVAADKLALMGILGAFVFAGQMVNFQLPAMPGTSGHMIGAVLLAIILGPHLGAIWRPVGPRMQHYQYGPCTQLSRLLSIQDCHRGPIQQPQGVHRSNDGLRACC